jgi:predicted nucleotidyltransferase
MDKEKILSQMKNKLLLCYGDRLKGVVLFGSEARGTSEPDSDIDVMVLLDCVQDYGSELKNVIHELYPLTLEYERPVSPLIVEFDKYNSAEYPLYKNIKNEGIVA